MFSEGKVSASGFCWGRCAGLWWPLWFRREERSHMGSGQLKDSVLNPPGKHPGEISHGEGLGGERTALFLCSHPKKTLSR